jgi:hypothetical protein
MGQQQLLLLVLGIVIVGLAVVVGIQAFGENQKKANTDALVNDGVRIASDAQAWVLKPAAFGGGNGAPAGLNTDGFEKLGYRVIGTGNDAKYGNLNGEFTMAADASKITILGGNTSNQNYVAVGVWGTSPECVATQISSTALTAAPAKPGGCTATTGSF